MLRDEFEVIAYRGGAGERPENTLAAFEHATGLSSDDIIDLDLQLSKDQEVMVIHDESVDRTTNGTGAVARIYVHRNSSDSTPGITSPRNHRANQLTNRKPPMRVPPKRRNPVLFRIAASASRCRRWWKYLADLIRRLHDHGKKLWVYTVDNP